jgi:glucosamine--fructose-6-phosphate aminotransferase (isomerizing)
VVNAVGSLIARTTKLGVYCNAGRENGVASTKAFTTQVAVMALVTCWFRQVRDESLSTDGKESTQTLMEALARLPISFGLSLSLFHRHASGE